MNSRLRQPTVQRLEGRRLLTSDLVIAPPLFSRIGLSETIQLQNQYIARNHRSSALNAEATFVTTLNADTAEVRIGSENIQELTDDGIVLVTHEPINGNQPTFQVDQNITNQGRELTVSIDVDSIAAATATRFILPHGHFVAIDSQLSAEKIEYVRSGSELGFGIDQKFFHFQGTNLTVIDNLSAVERDFHLTDLGEDISVTSGQTIFVRSVDLANPTSNRLAMGFLEMADRIRVYPGGGEDNLSLTSLDRIPKLEAELGLGAEEKDELAVPDGFAFTVVDPIAGRTVFSLSNGLSVATIAISGDRNHNLVRATDVNFDGATTTTDALLVINALDGRLITDSFFRDVTDDNSITALDALVVINHLATNAATEPELVTDRLLLDFLREEDERLGPRLH